MEKNNLFLAKNGWPKRFCLVNFLWGKEVKILEKGNCIPEIVRFCQAHDYSAASVEFELPQEWPNSSLRPVTRAEKNRFLNAAGLRTPRQRAKKKKYKAPPIPK